MATSEESHKALLASVVRQLNSIADLETIWKRGLVHHGGPHFRLRGSAGPVSIGEDECLLLAKLITRFRPAHCFIIGNGFGLSSTFIAKVMEANGGVSVITLDDKSEGPGERCFGFSEALSTQIGCPILENKYGVSPQDVDWAIESDVYDFIFIDGEHSHPQVSQDFQAIQHLLSDEGIVCWHDYWISGVAESVAEAERKGLSCVKVNSSCEMVFGTRNEKIAHELQLLLKNTVAPIPRRHPWARLKLMFSFMRSRPKFFV